MTRPKAQRSMVIASHTGHASAERRSPSGPSDTLAFQVRWGASPRRVVLSVGAAALTLSAAVLLPPGSSTARARPRAVERCQPWSSHDGKVQSVADLDGDGRPEQLWRCPGAVLPKQTVARRCDELLLALSRDGKRFPVARLCKPPLGVAGARDRAKLTAKGRQLVVTRSGGSAWAWQAACTLHLGQRKVTSLERRARWRVEPARHSEVQHHDFLRHQSEVRWVAPRCQGRSKRPGLKLFRASYRPIPVLAEGQPGAWPPSPKHDPRCTLSLTKWGYLLAGRRSTSKDRVAVWAIDHNGELLLRVSLSDDHLLPSDRLHLWLGRTPTGYSEACVRSTHAEHLVFSDLGGSVLGHPATSPASAGLPTGVSLRAARSGRRRWLEIRLAPARRRQALRHGLAIAYQDVDLGGKARTLGSARLDLRSGAGLGEVTRSLCRRGPQGRLLFTPPRSCSLLIP